jgi:hypothetical protein
MIGPGFLESDLLFEPVSQGDIVAVENGDILSHCDGKKSCSGKTKFPCFRSFSEY